MLHIIACRELAQVTALTLADDAGGAAAVLFFPGPEHQTDRTFLDILKLPYKHLSAPAVSDSCSLQLPHGQARRLPACKACIFI